MVDPAERVAAGIRLERRRVIAYLLRAKLNLFAEEIGRGEHWKDDEGELIDAKTALIDGEEG